MKVAAPGKLFLTGAYAVLEGAPAIVVAVDRFAVADTERAPEGAIRPEIAAVARLLDASPPHVDTSTLESDGRKLGLGSSAAGAVAAAGAILAARGLALDGTTLERVREVAFDAHAESQPRGSGGDIAAAVHGGVVRVRRTSSRLEAAPTRLPRGLEIRAFSSARAARTSDALDRLASRRATSAVESAFASLAAAAHAGSDACDRNDLPAFLAACADHAGGLAALGDAIDLPLFPAELRDAKAQPRSIVLLPSGAGGGDVVLWLGIRAPTDHETRALGDRGLSALSLLFEVRGVHRLEFPEEQQEIE